MQILSGTFEGKTLGTPISMWVKNEDARPEAYSEVAFPGLFNPVALCAGGDGGGSSNSRIYVLDQGDSCIARTNPATGRCVEGPCVGGMLTALALDEREGGVWCVGPATGAGAAEG